MYQDTAVTTAEIAGMAATEPPVALRELRRLAHLNVLTETAAGWLPGAGFIAWKRTPVTTKVGAGGNSKSYQHAKAIRDAIRQRAWNEKRTGLTDQAPDTARREPTNDSVRGRLQRLGVAEPLLTTYQVSLILGVTDRTLIRYDRSGLLHPVRVGPRLKRYRAKDIHAFVHAAG